jgi:hypothetical protein
MMMRNKANLAMAKIDPITANPRYATAVADLTKLEKRLAETRKRRERALALKRGVPAGRTKVERAKDLVAGAFVPAIDPDKELLACDEEDAVLRGAIVQKAQQIEEMRGNLSEIVCRRFDSEHTAALRAAIKAIQEMGTAFRVAAELRVRIRDAGYAPLETFLPGGMPPFVLTVGDGNGDGRQIDQWKRYIEMHSHVKL